MLKSHVWLMASLLPSTRIDFLSLSCLTVSGEKPGHYGKLDTDVKDFYVSSNQRWVEFGVNLQDSFPGHPESGISTRAPIRGLKLMAHRLNLPHKCLLFGLYTLAFKFQLAVQFFFLIGRFSISKSGTEFCL